MEQIYQWNLKPIESFLKLSSTEGWQKSVESVLANMTNNRLNLSIEERFQHLMQVDSHIDRVWSALNLVSLQRSTPAPGASMEGWLFEVSQALIDQLEKFTLVLSCHNEPLPDLIKRWSLSLQEVQQLTELNQEYRAIVRAGSAIDASYSGVLLKRSQIDPEARALHSRLTQNGLSLEEIEFTETHAQECHHYFDRLFSSPGAESAWLSDIRQFEASQCRISGPEWTDALACVCSAFESIHPICKAYAQDTINNGQIRQTRDRTQPDMSIDTPFGSFVQLHYDESLYGLVRLAHELGHAIHQRLHRESMLNVIALSDVDSETWAMAFESNFMEALRTCCPEWTNQIEAFQDFQRIEMNHRHRMLAQFEYSLHNPTIQDKVDIEQLWIQENHKFYGPNIRLEPEFKSAWKEVSHLFNAPFYLSVYAIAKERADQCDLRAMIQDYQSKRN